MKLEDSFQRALSWRKAGRHRASAERLGQTLIFTHIAKCGGTSLRQMIFESVAHLPRATLFVPGFSPASTEARIGTVATSRNRRISILAGHFNYGAHEILKIQSPNYFTLLREPVERTISHYYFFLYPITRRRLSDLTNAERRRILPVISNAITKILRGREPWRTEWETDFRQLHLLQKRALSNLLGSYRAFGLLEDLPRSLLLLKSQIPWLDLNFDPGVKLNQTLLPDYSPANEPAAIRRAIEDMNAPDVELYAEAKAHFEGRSVFLGKCYNFTAPAGSL